MSTTEAQWSMGQVCLIPMSMVFSYLLCYFLAEDTLKLTRQVIKKMASHIVKQLVSLHKSSMASLNRVSHIKRGYNINFLELSRITYAHQMRSFCIKTNPSLVLPFCTFNRGYSRNSRSRMKFNFITNSILLLIKVDTLHFTKAQRVIHKHSQEKTKMMLALCFRLQSIPGERGVVGKL